MFPSTVDDGIRRAADVIRSADALLIGTGAGMGVDSGLPDFRGANGFWKAYPAFKELGLDFHSLANTRWFQADPSLAWGFYGHRLNLYRDTTPHAGFAILKKWAERMRLGARIFTSNVDGHFQRSGFPEEHVLEIHGSILFGQCNGICGTPIFSIANVPVAVDPTTIRARPPYPACPVCGGMARPNILLFSDYGWDESRTVTQGRRLDAWLNELAGAKVVVVEIGAGTTIPAIRNFSERRIDEFAGATLIRINPTDDAVPDGQISIAARGLETLRAIDALLA